MGKWHCQSSPSKCSYYYVTYSNAAWKFFIKHGSFIWPTGEALAKLELDLNMDGKPGGDRRCQQQRQRNGANNRVIRGGMDLMETTLRLSVPVPQCSLTDQMLTAGTLAAIVNGRTATISSSNLSMTQIDLLDTRYDTFDPIPTSWRTLVN